MASIAYLEGYHYIPRIDKEVLEAHSKGIICLSGCASSEFSDYILLDQLDSPGVTLRDRTFALAAIARIQISYTKLANSMESDNAGTSVRKYASAFAYNAISGRTRISRSAPAPSADDPDYDDIFGGDDGDDYSDRSPAA